MHPVNCLLLLSSLLAYLLHYADGCGRTPARTKPPPTTPNPNDRTTVGPGGPTTRRPSQIRLVCTQPEVKEAACLHGGECFALELLDTRSAHCHCSEMWTGTRCEQIDEGFFVLSADKVEKAGIAAGVVAIIIILTVIVVYLIIKKRKQRKERAEENGQTNGCAGKKLIADKERQDDDEKCTDV